LSLRTTNLARRLARRVDGTILSDFERGEIRPDLFRRTCIMGLEGLVSKHRDSSCRAGRFDRWIKVKKSVVPAFSRRGLWFLAGANLGMRKLRPDIGNASATDQTSLSSMSNSLTSSPQPSALTSTWCLQR